MDTKLIRALVMAALLAALAVPAAAHNDDPPQSPRGDMQEPASLSR